MLKEHISSCNVFPGHTSLSFAGNSYIKYRLSENSKEEDLKLALRLRTLQSNGIVMYTQANPCMILKVHKTAWLF
jgi:protocadherin Fat 1/2/3